MPAAASPEVDLPLAGQGGLYDRPVLVVELGVHTAMTRRASVDATATWAVTGSDDKTIRIWLLADGKLERTIRLPAGPGDVGTALAVAMCPDGSLIAVGGRTGPAESKCPEQIYLFERTSGEMKRRIVGLPTFVAHLLFSPDGERLVATLATSGVRVFARERDWAEVARDEDYDSNCYGAAFAPDGRLAVASYDGKVQLYCGDFSGAIRPTRVYATSAGRRPYSVAFSPDGAHLAVGYDDALAVEILDGRTLKLSGRNPDFGGIEGGDVASVAWSQDGQTLFAAGTHPPKVSASSPAQKSILAWDERGAAAPRLLAAGQTTVMSLMPLPGGDLLVAAGDPWLARLKADGTPRWVKAQAQADFRGQFNSFSVSPDGTMVDFGYTAYGEVPARFDLTKPAMQLSPAKDGRTSRPVQDGLPFADCFNTTTPKLGDHRLPLHPYEISRCLAVHPAKDRFVLGADWSLAAYDSSGNGLWRRSVPGAVWAVNISADGRLVVTAHGDSTIRWMRMDNGMELLAFMPLPDRNNWVAWTPEGFYAATPGAHGVLHWHVNHGFDAPADTLSIADIPGSFRPMVLPLILRELETPRALGLAELAEHNLQIGIRTKSKIPPGTRLHLLAIGISVYNEQYAKWLRLSFAERDAYDLASAIVNTQASLYGEVLPQVLVDQDANKDGILRAFQVMRRNIAAGGGNDLAIVHFSGHGALVDGKLFLLPYEVDARGEVGIKSKAIAANEFRDELLKLAEYGRVLVLLDACHSGATTMDGKPLAMDSSNLRTALAAANVTVLTSSSGQEVSREDPRWEHGAFTKVLLDAFSDPAADSDNDGLINTTGLAHYVSTRVSALTNGAQNPGMEVRFDTTVFARSLVAPTHNGSGSR